MIRHLVVASLVALAVAAVSPAARCYARKPRVAALTPEQRFAKLAELVSAQARNEGWAAAREAEIRSLPSRHEYFKQTTFAIVDCRATMCRVVATFPNTSEQGTFDTVFSGFVPTFSYAMTREISYEGKPAIEAFLSLDDPLPR